MGIIQCSEDCRFQADGYCGLENLSTVSLSEKDCPYYKKPLFYNGNSLSQTFNTNKL